MLSIEDYNKIRAVLKIEDIDAAITELLNMYMNQDTANVSKLINRIPAIVSAKVAELDGNNRSAYEAGTAIGRAFYKRQPREQYLSNYDVLAFFVGRFNFHKLYIQANTPNAKRFMLMASKVAATEPEFGELFVRRFIKFIDTEYAEYRDDELYNALHLYGIESLSNSWAYSSKMNWLYRMETALNGVVDMCEWCYTNRDKWDDITTKEPENGK